MIEIKDPFRHQREVSFFLRLHRHLPDGKCGGMAISPCEYRADKKAINYLNAPVEELQKDSEFKKKEDEIVTAVKEFWERNEKDSLTQSRNDMSK